MTLDRPLQVLIEEGPQHGIPKIVMEKAVTPVLKGLAEQLRHSDYYLLQTPEGNWLTTVLSHRKKSQPDRVVLYAFATAEDAAQFQSSSTQSLQIACLPATHLLFQLLALEGVDSLIFREIPGNLRRSREIGRADLRALVDKQLRRLKVVPSSQPHPSPSSFA